MPEHFHLLITEPEQRNPSIVMKVLKQGFARQVLRKGDRRESTLWAQFDGAHIWQKRFYDFNVWSERTRMEKLRDIHRNPVKRGLVSSPEQWRWSSFRAYAYGEKVVRVNCQEWGLKVKGRES